MTFVLFLVVSELPPEDLTLLCLSNSSGAAVGPFFRLKIDNWIVINVNVRWSMNYTSANGAQVTMPLPSCAWITGQERADFSFSFRQQGAAWWPKSGGAGLLHHAGGLTTWARVSGGGHHGVVGGGVVGIREMQQKMAKWANWWKIFGNMENKVNSLYSYYFL